MKQNSNISTVNILTEQTNMFDIIEKNPKEISKESLESVKTNTIEVPETIIENKKTENLEQLTKEQQQYIDKNNILNNKNVSKIIIHSKGSISIEYKIDEAYKSEYINKNGKLEFSYPDKTPVMPWDEIYYYSDEIFYTDVQNQIVEELKQNLTGIIDIIKRKGDEKIFILLKDKILGITRDGITLPYNITNIKYKNDEIVEKK